MRDSGWQSMEREGEGGEILPVSPSDGVLQGAVMVYAEELLQLGGKTNDSERGRTQEVESVRVWWVVCGRTT